MSQRRVFLVVMDACGIGAMPDATAFGDPPGANTLGNVASACGGLHLPNLGRMGLGNLTEIAGTPPCQNPIASFGKATLASPGKDTTTGHWEIAGIVLDKAFDVFPDGFPDQIINSLLNQIQCEGFFGNVPASGTAIIDQYHKQHAETGWPIIYTSADSVFQIAADIDIVPITTLYKWCEVARKILDEQLNVGRVIARPYRMENGVPTRQNGLRRDYAVPPTSTTVLDDILAGGGQVFGIGKIADIFLGQGISASVHTKSNADGIAKTLDCMQGTFVADDGTTFGVNGEVPQLVFVNLVDTDAVYGHRNNPTGFGEALLEIDEFVGDALSILRSNDLLILTADHGCDPTVPGTDHTREYTPVLAFNSFAAVVPLQTLPSLSCLSDMVANWIGIQTLRKTEQVPS